MDILREQVGSSESVQLATELEECPVTSIADPQNQESEYLNPEYKYVEMEAQATWQLSPWDWVNHIIYIYLVWIEPVSRCFQRHASSSRNELFLVIKLLCLVRSLL